MPQLSGNYNRGMAATSADANRLRSLGIELREFVFRAKQALDEEIRSYPTPIPRCDAQFNHAYEQRSRLAACLHRVDDALDRGDDASGLLSAMAEFAALPSTDGSVAEQRLRARMAEALSRAGPAVESSPARSAVDLPPGAG